MYNQGDQRAEFPVLSRGGGGGLRPYVAYTGSCRWTGYVFWPLCPEQGIYFYASAVVISVWTCHKLGMVARLSSLRPRVRN